MLACPMFCWQKTPLDPLGQAKGRREQVICKQSVHLVIGLRMNDNIGKLDPLFLPTSRMKTAAYIEDWPHLPCQSQYQWAITNRIVVNNWPVAKKLQSVTKKIFQIRSLSWEL